MNVSVFDALAGVRVVKLNITNGTGEQNATYTATKEGTTNQYSVSVATTGFKDGNYTVTVYANDTTNGGNLNNSARATEIKFDNTPPTVTVSCTPSPVISGNTITCTCARSDATSGVNTVVFTPNPSTSSTGTFTSSCTVTDLAGNSATGSTTYIVESSGSGSSSSGGGGTTTSTWTTYSVAGEAFETGHTRDLKENQRLKVNVETTSAGGTTTSEEHFVGVVDVTANSALIEVSSTPQRATMNVGETKKFEVTGDNYYDISVTLNSILDNKAKITVLSVHEAIPAPEPAPVEEEVVPEVVTAPLTEEAGGTSAVTWAILIIIIIVIVTAIAAWFLLKKK